MEENHTHPLVSVIVVSWNGMDFLPACLDSIKSQTYPQVEILVVDNGSTDHSIAYLESRKDIILIRNPKNLGFSAGNNQGIARAQGDWVFLLNMDARLEPDCLQRLLERMLEEQTIGSASPKIYRSDGKTLDSTGILLQKRRFSPADRGENQSDQGQYDSPDQEAIFGPSAAAALYRKEALGEASMGREIFDEAFFAYYEDVDLAWRLRLFGWQSVYVPNAVCTHDRKGPSKKPERIQCQAYANRYFCYIKNEMGGLIPYYLFPAIFYESGRAFKLIFRHPWMAGYIFIVLKNFRSMLRKRRWIKKRRKATLEEMKSFR